MALDRSSVKSILMVFMIVSSSLLAPVATASADEFRTYAASNDPEAGECSKLDDFIMFLSVGRLNADSCSRQAYVDAAITDMKESDANQTKLDIYTAASQQKAGEKTFKAPFSNYLQDTDTVAWTKAESATATAYSNGANEEAAKIEAKEAIAEYYTDKAVNLIEQWNSTVVAHKTLQQQAAQEDGISSSYVRVELEQDSTDYSGFSIEETTVTLPNQTEHGVKVLKATTTDPYSSSVTVHPGVDPDSQSSGTENGHTITNISALSVMPPNDNYERLTYGDTQQYHDYWTQIQTQNANLQNESNNFVGATWEDYDSGQINASDVLSANTAMSEYGVRSANESEGLWRSTAALSMMGYDTPDLNNSGMMTVEYRNQNLTGLLMARNAPNGTWEVNTTYNTSNIDGPVFMTTTDGKKIDFADGEEFEIVGMTAKDGSQLNSTQTTKYRYKTANTSELLEVQNQLIELRQEIEDREPSAGGSFDLGSTDTMLVGLLALAGALLMMQNQNRGGRR